MGRPLRRAASLTGRAVLRSPERPRFRASVLVTNRQGLTSEDAAIACGVSGPAGSRWFRHAGGVQTSELTAVSGRYLSFSERIAILRARRSVLREVARHIRRSPSTFPASVTAQHRHPQRADRVPCIYRAVEGQPRRKTPKSTKLAEYERLREYLQDKLCG